MSELKIRLVPPVRKNEPDFETYKNLVIFAQKKFTVLRPDEDGDSAVMIVLPFWLEPFRKLTEMLGDLKVGDYFSHSFVVQYIDDSTNTDLNNFRLDKSAYVSYDANAILRGQKRWSDLWPIHEYDRVIVDCEMDNTLARAASSPEKRLEQDEMVLFKSCRNATEKNKPKPPKQTESNRRLPTRRTESPEVLQSSVVEPVRSPARTTCATRKRARKLDSDSDDDDAFRTAQPSAVRTSPRKKVIDANNNQDANAQKRKPKPTSTAVGSAISHNVHFGDLNSFSPISPPGERNQDKWKTKKQKTAAAPPEPQASSSSARTADQNQNDTDQIDLFSSDDEFVPNTSSSSRSSSPSAGPTTVKAGNGKRAYTPSEDMAILRFLDEHKRHRNVKGLASYNVMAELQYFKSRGRTGQGMCSRFKDYIKPKIRTILKDEPEMLRRFKDGLKYTELHRNAMPEPFEKKPPWNWEPKQN